MYTSFMKKWITTVNRGFSINQYINNKGWKNISIFGAGTIAELLISYMNSDTNKANYNIVNIIDTNKNGKYFELPIVKPVQVGQDIDAIIVTPFLQYYVIRNDLMQYTDCDIVSIKDIIEWATPSQAIDTISEFLVDKNITLHFIGHPTSKMFSNPSLLELSYSPNSTNCKDPHFFKSLHDDIDYYSDEYYHNIIDEKPVVIDYTVTKMININTKYFNAINGFRFVPDLPPNPQNNIYIFGSCFAAGFGAEDKRTFANHLQILINKNNLSYGVNSSIFNFYVMSTLESFFETLKELPLKKNDIVLFVYRIDDPYQKINLSCFSEFPNVFQHDMTNAFSRPHKYGEVFVDISHMTHRGYELLAHSIFNILQSNKVLKTQNTTEARSPVHYAANNSSNTTDINLNNYLELLKHERVNIQGNIGSIVVNCNPFTLGHKYLIETAAADVDFLYIFVVEEDKSLFPFKERLELVKKGTQHLSNVKVLASGQYIISTITLPDYFTKDSLPTITIDASKDIQIFSQYIAPILGITHRFAGHEPYCKITKQYNQYMKDIFPSYGIKFKEVERLKSGNIFISASEVRRLLKNKDFKTMKNLVPSTTLEYLRKNYDIILKENSN